MNKDNAKDFLPLVQAIADGKTIQLNTGRAGNRIDEDDWADLNPNNVVLGFYPATHYRIKPEPEELVAVYKKNNCRVFIGKQKGAEAYMRRNFNIGEKFTTKKFIETD